jgi:hypothetical protein
MTTLPTIAGYLDTLNRHLDETEAKIDFITSNLNIIGSNADVFANSIFNTANADQMYGYLKSSSNVLRIVTIPS